ncbi:hypothetical protein AB205_0126200, partial [Aquarana catesbeiana]
AQAGWLQHDFGHLSVFKTSKWNHIGHKFVIGHLKVLSQRGLLEPICHQGASANWWNHRHFQHHAKPNIFSKDPDVNMVHIFVLGDTQPVEYGKKKLKYLPYNHQHQYFFLIGPPLLIPVYFTVQIMKTMITRKDWVDLAWSLSYYTRFFFTFVPYFGVLGSIALLTTVRFIESHWFVWVTQMNHIPMEIDHEKYRDWLGSQVGGQHHGRSLTDDDSSRDTPSLFATAVLYHYLHDHHMSHMLDLCSKPAWTFSFVLELPVIKTGDCCSLTLYRLAATCNIEQSFFNDWFSGHLNFQIEHHLFPTMPRHNYYKIAPFVRSLCKKYEVLYEEKPMWKAFTDIIGSLRKSGDLWLDAYLHK